MANLNVYKREDIEGNIINLDGRKGLCVFGLGTEDWACLLHNESELPHKHLCTEYPKLGAKTSYKYYYFFKHTGCEEVVKII